MNKITSTLTGLALVAAASVAPAFAQGNLFTPAGTMTSFTFGTVSGSPFSVSGAASFNSSTSTTTNVPFIITGSDLNGPLYTISSFTLNGKTDTFGPGAFFILTTPSPGVTSLSSVGVLPDGNTFNLIGSPPAVPEASTVVSFGALLALGGLAVVLRRKGVKNAA